jgi:Tfp pilus assembly ATPase PilU
MRISERDAQGERDIYDSECMARDVVDAIDATMNAEIGETFERGHDHAFNVVTPHGRRFLITVSESHRP